MNGNILDIRHLKVEFHTSKGVVHAVDGVNLEVRSGEVVGLVGESGCGKSTVAHTIVQLIQIPPGKIINGQVLFKGQDLLNLTENQMRHEIRGREIAMIFQDPMTYLNPVMKVGRQIAETLRTHQGLSSTAADRRSEELLSKVQIPAADRVARSYPHQLSGGMRQRAMIAMAISCNPSLLIADEPTTALDVTVQAQIIKLLQELISEIKSSMILITHNLGVVAEICDWVCVIYCGKVVEYGTVFHIFENPSHPYTIGLLKSVLSIEQFKENLSAIEGAVPNLMVPPSGCPFHPRCEKRRDICRKETPESQAVEPGHLVWCWLGLDGNETDRRIV